MPDYRQPTGGAAGSRLRASTLAIATALALFACLWAGVGSSGAVDTGALKGQINSARQQAQRLAAQVQASQNGLKGAEARARASARRESDLAAMVAASRGRAADLAKRADVAQGRLREAQAQLHRAVGILTHRLVAIYKGSVPDAVDVILSSHGFDDLATRAEYLRLVENSDTALATRVRGLRNDVAGQLTAVRRLRDQANAYTARMEATLQQIAAARAAAASQAAALARAKAAAAGSLGDLRGKLGAWEQQLQRAQRISQVQAQQQVAHWVGNWAIPEAIVMCESGGNYHAVNGSSGAGGAYQIMPSTWAAYGGKGRPQDASPQEQSRIAAMIWRDSGPGAWVCAQ